MYINNDELEEFLMPSIYVNDDKLKELLKFSLNRFYKQDKLLVKRKGMEQACVFRIGLYINDLLKNDEHLKFFDLDCEYNKNNYGLKVTPRFPKGSRPDWIIHKRNLDLTFSNKNNIFIIEFKGWWNKTIERDIEKLEDFTSPYIGYHYQLGAFVKLNIDDYEIRFYKEGREESQ